MNIQIALSLLLNVIAISARSLQGYNCREYPVFTGNPTAPLRTVRVCGTLDYEATPNTFHLGSRTEDLVRRSPSTLYNGNSVWSSPAFQQYPKRWPLTPQSLSGYEPFNQIGSSSNNPSTNYNELNFRNSMEVQRSLQLQLGSLVEDVSEVKDSIGNLVPYVKDILDTLRMQNTFRETEGNVNVNFKLDPSFEALLRQFLQLIATTAEDKEDQTIVKSFQNVNSQEEEEEENTQSSSEEDTTAVPDTTTESSTEEDAIEVSDENGGIAGENSVENLENWLRLKFGPSAKVRTSDEEIDDMLNQTSEEENSAERSDESFETWFNAVYRRVSTEPTNDHNSQESTESTESTESLSNKYSTDGNWKNVNEVGNSFEASKESSENADNSDRDVAYETYFVPTTTSSIQEDTSTELLGSGDQYGYATENNSNVKLEEFLIHYCFRVALSTPTVDDKVFLKKYSECVETLNKNNKSKDSDEKKLEVDSGSSESKESAETEPAVTDLNESNEIGEKESAATDSNESKESEETNYSEENEMQ